MARVELELGKSKYADKLKKVKGRRAATTAGGGARAAVLEGEEEAGLGDDEATIRAKIQQQELLERVDQERKVQCKRLQQIESLKFEKDVSTGLTYFDSLNALLTDGNREVEGLKKRYKDNL